jgi:hemolysin III
MNRNMTTEMQISYSAPRSDAEQRKTERAGRRSARKAARAKANEYPLRPQNVEERLNSITHAMGAGLSIAALVYLLWMTSVNNGPAIAYVAFAIYGGFQILLYLSSASMHQFTDHPRWHKVLHIIDQAAIYLLIAGTYTPVTLLILKGALGWTLFGIVWGLAVLGIIMKSAIFTGRHIASDLLYLPMGWLIIVAIKPLIEAMPGGFFIWVIMGAASYSIGIIFYIFNKIPYSHVIWHLFVISGGLGFFIAFASYVV